MNTVDSIMLQVIGSRLSGIVQEMQQSLFRTGYSTIIRESQDASCAILDSKGRLVSQHIVLPLHSGSYPAFIEEIYKQYRREEMEQGDAFIINHPYFGGSPHASDVAIITPVFYESELVGFCGSMAHKSDIGGSVPGSGGGSAREIYQEGLHIPPIRIVNAYKHSKEIDDIIRSNSRTPDLVMGDIHGQIGANRVGEQRMKELMDHYNKNLILQTFEAIYAFTEKKVREQLKKWPDGTYEGEGWIDNDGIHLDRPIRIKVKIVKRQDTILFDFSESDDQVTGPVNIRPPLVNAACYYCISAWMDDPELLINDGLLRVIETKYRNGSILHPRFPAPVNSYIGTAQAVVETIVSVLGSWIPGKKMAGSCGSGALIFGGIDHDTGKQYVQYEIVAGGMGARSGKNGVSGTTVHVSNGRTASIEILESEFPVRVLRFELWKDSGGPGEFRGGLGYIREYLILNDNVRCSFRSDKHVITPKGMEGGLDAPAGMLVVNPGTDEEKKMPSRFGDLYLKHGDIVCVYRPGGGGIGHPMKRPAQNVLEDVRNGYVSMRSAETDYGVVIQETDAGWMHVEREISNN